jgi:hypothetical protein
VASDPLRAISTNSARGRLIHDTAALLLEGATDPGPLLIADAIGLAQLRVRAAELRENPDSDPLMIVRMEGAVARATRKFELDCRREPDTGSGLGALLARQYEQDAPESKALHEAAGAAGEPADAICEPPATHLPDATGERAPDAGAGQASTAEEERSASWDAMWSKPFAERGTP